MFVDEEAPEHFGSSPVVSAATSRRRGHGGGGGEVKVHKVLNKKKPEKFANVSKNVSEIDSLTDILMGIVHATAHRNKQKKVAAATENSNDADNSR